MNTEPKPRLIEPRVLKGFRDSLPATAIPRTQMIHGFEQVFASFGFVPIDTPALEYAEILLGKGSEETDRQLYRFTDNGGRDVALRFDLTVPLARFAATHMNELGTPFRRYHVAPVWRAEKPQRGRYREFIQCDFDVIGTRSLVADAEILLVTNAALDRVRIKHKIRVNNRLILNGLLAELGSRDASSAVLRAIDKLEKLGADAVAAELKETAGLSDDHVARIFSFLELSRSSAESADLAAELERFFAANETGKEGARQLRTVVEICREVGLAEPALAIDLSIARGLDYYTGTVFETSYLDLPHIGSICSGGRYDDLASLYSNRDLPGVGGSIGLDRILGALEALGRLEARSSTAEVLVAIPSAEHQAQIVSIASRLRLAGLSIEIYPDPGKLGNQLKFASRRGIPYAVILGESELAAGTAAVKELASGEQEEGIVLDRLAAYLLEKLGRAGLGID